MQINITGAGAGAKNVIQSGGAQAYVSSSTVTANNNHLVVNALDRSNITVDAGAVAFALIVATGGRIRIFRLPFQLRSTKSEVRLARICSSPMSQPRTSQSPPHPTH